jgi:hypothetical protein
MLKLSLEEREIESIDFSSLVVLGHLIATLSKKRPKTTSKIFSGNPPTYDRSFNEGTHLTIDAEGKISLTSPITKKEMFDALNSMKPYKAPGPDGFHCIFFK